MKRNAEPLHVAQYDMKRRAVSALPYRMRLAGYEREKSVLFDRIGVLSQSEIHAEHIRLARKWRI